MTPSPLDLSLHIVSTGMYVPERILTNADLQKIVDTTDEWIFTRTGIRERRIAAPGEFASDMGVKAARQAIENSDVTAAEIDLILVATVTGEAAFPSTACYIQEKLGATNAAAFDLQAACSGFLYGMVVAEQFLRSGVYKNIILIGTEKLSSIVDWTDRTTCVLFGDGAGAVLLSSKKGHGGMLSFDLGSNGAHHEMLHLYHSHKHSELGSEAPSKLPTLHMAGKEVFKQAVNVMAKSANKVLDAAGLTMADIRFVITHQANIRIIEAIAGKLEVPPEKCFTNVHRFGNMSAACIPVAMHEVARDIGLNRGDKILLVAFGGGLPGPPALSSGKSFLPPEG